MTYSDFANKCPEIAEHEFWRFTMPQPTHGLPSGDYLFVEMYCEDPDCDCQRLWLRVAHNYSDGACATIGYG